MNDRISIRLHDFKKYLSKINFNELTFSISEMTEKYFVTLDASVETPDGKRLAEGMSVATNDEVKSLNTRDLDDRMSERIRKCLYKCN